MSSVGRQEAANEWEPRQDLVCIWEVLWRLGLGCWQDWLMALN